MRILLANANTTEAITDRCAKVARAAASHGTVVTAITPRFGPRVITTRVEEAIAAHALLECIAEHHQGHDAVVLAVSLDTGLAAARQLLHIPVIGMTEAACLAACMVGARFGLVTFGRSVEMYRELVAHHGIERRCAGMRALPVSPTAMFEKPQETMGMVQRAALELVDAGADSILLAGAVLAGVAPSLDLPVPVIDGIASATKFAEAMVGLGLKKPSFGSHAAIGGRDSIGLSGRLAALLTGSS